MKHRRILVCLLASVFALTTPWQTSLAATHSKTNAQTAHQGTTSSSKKTQTKSKKTDRKKNAKTNKKVTRSGKTKTSQSRSAKTSSRGCRTVKVKTKKGYRNKKVCASSAGSQLSTPSREAALNGGAPAMLSNQPPEKTVRNVADRAYAVDGTSFFYKGQKYRIKGVNTEDIDTNSDLAKQKLQTALDKGDIVTESSSVDQGGANTAVVRVNGQDIAEMLKR